MSKKLEINKGDCFGVLTIIKEVKGKRRLFECQCLCGKSIIKRLDKLKSNDYKKCFCNPHTKTKSRIYGIWKGIKNRCNNKTCSGYKNYGGRGISYDKKWETFEGFFKDMESGYSDDLCIDRIDNNGNYCRKNCRWATKLQQDNNRRNNVFVTINGCTLTMANWARKTGISKNVIYSRFRKGMKPELVITLPVKKRILNNLSQ